MAGGIDFQGSNIQTGVCITADTLRLFKGLISEDMF